MSARMSIPIVVQCIPVLHGMHAGGTGCETGNLNQSPEFRVENWRLSSPSEFTRDGLLTAVAPDSCSAAWIRAVLQEFRVSG